jgi:hypothetical protein
MTGEPMPGLTNPTPTATRSRRCIPALSKGSRAIQAVARRARTNFDTTLLKEFYKPVSATINGKPIKVTNDKLFAASLVNDGITKGPQSKLQLADRVEPAEARWAAEAEVRKQPEAEKPFSWTVEQDKMYQELSVILGRRPE